MDLITVSKTFIATQINLFNNCNSFIKFSINLFSCFRESCEIRIQFEVCGSDSRPKTHAGGILDETQTTW